MSNAQDNVNTLAHVSTTADPGDGGVWPDVTSTAAIHRMRDRLFAGAAAVCTGNRTGTQLGPIPTGTEGANWAIRDGQVVVIAGTGNMAIVGMSRSEDVDPARNTSSIGVSGFAIGNNVAKASWAGYFDQQFEAGNYGYGIEIVVKNKEGVDRTSTPYFATNGTYGVWLPAGGDATYGGSPTHPNNTAIAIGSNSSTWNRGIVFFDDAITGTDGVTGTGVAINMAKGHRIVWGAPGNLTGFSIRSDVSAAASDVAILAGNNSISFGGAGGLNILQMQHVASGVNYLQFTNAVAGSGPRLLTAGASADVDLQIIPQGAGCVIVQISNVASYASDVLAAAGGVPVGGIYRNGSALQIRVS